MGMTTGDQATRFREDHETRRLRVMYHDCDLCKEIHVEGELCPWVELEQQVARREFTDQQRRLRQELEGIRMQSFDDASRVYHQNQLQNIAQQQRRQQQWINAQQQTPWPGILTKWMGL